MNLFSLFSYSQSPDKKETVEFMNKVLDEKIRIELKGATLIVTFYDDEMKVVREDKVPTPDLDLTFTYEEDAGLLCVPCMNDQPECVTRVLTLQKIKRRYGRLSIPVKDQDEYASLRNALDHLIRTTSENGYKEAVILD